jgi:hypothetical protein
MNPLRSRTKFVSCLAIGLFVLTLLYSCASPKTETTSDPKAELISLLKGANVDGYTFAEQGDEKQEIVSLTNGAARDKIKLEKGATNVVLNYYSVKGKKTNSSRTYKTEIVKTGNEVQLVVTDVATGEVVSKETFPPAEPHLPTGPTFNSLEECIADFNCRRRPAIQAEANRTCRAQRAGVTCCPPDGGICTIVDFLITPTRRVCGLIGPLDDV